MIKRIFGMAVIAALLVSCGNSTDEKTAAVQDQSQKAEISFTSLTETPDDFIGKEITVEGKVVHVCMHSGKKMYIVGEDPDIRLFISASEDVAKFPTELLGSEITVTGILNRVEAGADMEKEHVGAEEGEACETEEAMAKQPVLADMVLNYKDHSVK